MKRANTENTNHGLKEAEKKKKEVEEGKGEGKPLVTDIE